MENVKNLLYAGLGLAKQTEDQFKARFEVLVEKGKQIDSEGKNVLGDFFKSIDDQKSKLGETYNDQLTKVEDFIKKIKTDD